MEISFCGLSDRGRVRKNNEDNSVICDLTSGEQAGLGAAGRYRLGARGALIIVADGMGGEAGGEVASQLAVATIPKRLAESSAASTNPSEEEIALFVKEAIEYANRTIFQRAQSNPAYRGMGTTVTVAVLVRDTLFVEQVGDSRAYLIRTGRLTQLTRDQTFLNYLADLGAKLPADPESDSRRSILTQAVGAMASIEVEVTFTPLHQGDRILLCSDGLYSMVKPPDLARLAGAGDSLERTCRALVDFANQKGGTDNITVVLAEARGTNLRAADSSGVVEVKKFSPQDPSL